MSLRAGLPEWRQKTLWRVKNAWHVLIAFVYPFSFLSFFVMGYRAQEPQWTRWGGGYALLLLLPLLIGGYWARLFSLLAFVALNMHLLFCLDTYLDRLVSTEEKRATRKKPVTPLCLQGDLLKGMDPIWEKHVDNKLKRPLSTIRERLLEIQQHAQRYPGYEGRLRKVRNYYIPEIIRLTELHRELGSAGAQNEETRATLQKIELTLDSVAEAFAVLRNSLRGDLVLETQANTRVLSAMMQEDGLCGLSADIPSVAGEKNSGNI